MDASDNGTTESAENPPPVVPVESQLRVRHLGTVDYEPVWAAMQAFTDRRDDNTVDEFWWLQHRPVFTQGQAGKPEHLLATGDIRIVHTDRGGQVTYHGPGQLVAYLMIDLKRRGLGVRALVSAVEQAIISVLADYRISAHGKADAPGVYVDHSDAKIAQLGFRVRRGRSFHGLSLNIDMDLEPFSRINPCGYQGLKVTDMTAECDAAVSIEQVALRLSAQLSADLGYTHALTLHGGALPA